ncbi:hypothetical protein BDW22DRAFT_1483544 [Trametopsis cervina]|nr:hypothetical protein BDW22DRAFT_1483544 [Trametopsis cervina]
MSVKQIAHQPTPDRPGIRALEAQVPHLFHLQHRRSRPRRLLTYTHSPLSLDSTNNETNACVLQQPTDNVSTNSSFTKIDASMRSRSSSNSSHGGLGPATSGQSSHSVLTSIPPGSRGGRSRPSSTSAYQQIIKHLERIIAEDKVIKVKMQKKIDDLEKELAEARKEANERVEKARKDADERVEKARKDADERVEKANERVEKERKEANERVEKERKEANERVEKERKEANERVEKANDQAAKTIAMMNEQMGNVMAMAMAANNNLQAANDELKATNDELKAANKLNAANEKADEPEACRRAAR